MMIEKKKTECVGESVISRDWTEMFYVEETKEK